MTQIQKNLVSLGVLVVLAAGAGAYAWFGVHKKEAAEKEAKETASKAFAFDKGSVKKVTLVAKGETVVAEKDGENWKIVSPVASRGDKYAFDAIVDKFKDLKSKETLADDRQKLAEWGLDKPKFQAKLALADGKELSLDVGEENPFDLSLPYVKGGDDHVYLADSGLKWPLDKSLFDLRDKALVTHEDKDVQVLTVASEATEWSVGRAGDNWMILMPTPDKADKSVVEGVLSRVRYARAKAFAAEEPAAADLKKWGLDKPVAMVTFSLGADKASKTLQFGRVDENGTKKVYARLLEGGPVMEVEEALPNDVAKPLSDLRDKTVAPFDREMVTRLQIEADALPKLVVTRTKEAATDGGFAEEKFAIADHADAKPKTWKLSSALYTLSSLKGAAVAEDNATDLAIYGLDKPAKTFTVFGEGDKALAKFLVGKPTGSRYYVGAAGSTRVYEVEKTTVDDLPTKLDDIVEAPPAPPPAPAAGKTGPIETAPAESKAE